MSCLLSVVYRREFGTASVCLLGKQVFFSVKFCPQVYPCICVSVHACVFNTLVYDRNSSLKQKVILNGYSITLNSHSIYEHFLQADLNTSP